MIAAYHVYRGHKNSLLAMPTIGFVYHLNNLPEYEKLVPSIVHIYRKKNLKNVLKIPVRGLEVKYINIPGEQYNYYGNYIIKKEIDKLASVPKAIALENNISLKIENLLKPYVWYKRAAAKTAIHYRSILLKSNSVYNHYLDLETNVEEQIKYLNSCIYLPMEYDWMKTMKTFKDVYPKPKWWYKEINDFNNLVKKGKK